MYNFNRIQRKSSAPGARRAGRARSRRGPRSSTCPPSSRRSASVGQGAKLEAKLDETERKLYTEKRTVFAGWLKGLFIGQALVPLSDISLDGTPMGFDLTLQLHTKQQPTGGATRASVAVELTFNPLS